jgi:hypothetical protein
MYCSIALGGSICPSAKSRSPDDQHEIPPAKEAIEGMIGQIGGTDVGSVIPPTPPPPPSLLPAFISSPPFLNVPAEYDTAPNIDVTKHKSVTHLLKEAARPSLILTTIKNPLKSGLFISSLEHKHESVPFHKTLLRQAF